MIKDLKDPVEADVTTIRGEAALGLSHATSRGPIPDLKCLVIIVVALDEDPVILMILDLPTVDEPLEASALVPSNPDHVHHLVVEVVLGHDE